MSLAKKIQISKMCITQFSCCWGILWNYAHA